MFTEKGNARVLLHVKLPAYEVQRCRIVRFCSNATFVHGNAMSALTQRFMASGPARWHKITLSATKFTRFGSMTEVSP
jgi:hypothetical protein